VIVNTDEAWQLEQELIEILCTALDKAQPLLDKEEFTTLLYATGLTRIYQAPATLKRKLVPKLKGLDMPRVNEMLPSTYLKKEDIPEPQLLTIAAIDQVVIADESGDKTKWAMMFSEHEKALVLNNTNIQLAAMVCGSDNSDDWIGRKIVLYADPNVSFAGKLVGGLRLRAPKTAKPKTQPAAARMKSAVAPAPADDLEDDIPF
jgi:hypothetical protein